MQFIPNEVENECIKLIQKYNRNEFALIRMTPTMLSKSIIDASQSIRQLLKFECEIDYDNLIRGEKYYDTTLLLSKRGISEIKTSYYQPNAKKYNVKGDPRFWIYGLKNNVVIDNLIYFTSYNNQLVAIVLDDTKVFEKNLIDLFGANVSDDKLLDELLGKVSALRNRGWIESIAPNRMIGNKMKSAPKDAGETFETCLGIEANSLRDPDYGGEIELKTRRVAARANSTLFSMVPDYNISRVKSSNEMILTYGYLSRKYEGYKDLYVTVNNVPNNQGLYIFSNDDEQILSQFHIDNDNKIDTAFWVYEEMKYRLYNKHKKTLWVNVDEQIIDGKICFKYLSAELTQKPIFTQFTSLINQGKVVYDWRGRVRLDGTGYKDKGHAFRISNANRNLLFGESKVIDFGNI